MATPRLKVLSSVILGLIATMVFSSSSLVAPRVLEAGIMPEDSTGKPDMILQYCLSNPHAGKKSHMRNRRIQLWTDSTFSEFAIIHDSRILMETKKDTTYNTLIDEVKCQEEFDYDWDFMLSQWVPLYFSNKYLKRISHPTEASEKKTVGHIENVSKVVKFKGPEVMRRLKLKPKSKPGLKCHFCNLKYSLEEERREHEELWHGN